MTTEVMELAKTLVSSREKQADWLRLNASTRHGLPWDENKATARATSTEKTVEKTTENIVPVKGDPGQPGQPGAPGASIDESKLIASIQAKLDEMLRNLPSGPKGEPGQPGTVDESRLIELIRRFGGGTNSTVMPNWLKTALLLLVTGGSSIGLWSLFFPRTDTTVINPPPVNQSGSLLQYLEDEGYHIGDSP